MQHQAGSGTIKIQVDQTRSSSNESFTMFSQKIEKLFKETKSHLFRRGYLVDLALAGGNLDAVLEPRDSRLGLAGRAARHDEPGVARPLHDGRLQPGHNLGSLVMVNMVET